MIYKRLDHRRTIEARGNTRFDDEELAANRNTRDPVSKVEPSATVKRKKAQRTTSDGLEVHSFHTLLGESDVELAKAGCLRAINRGDVERARQYAGFAAHTARTIALKTAAITALVCPKEGREIAKR